MTAIKTVFFGSTTDSVLVLSQLFSIQHSAFSINLTAVVTQPPRPIGRKHVLTPTPVELWSKDHNLTSLTFPSNPDHPNLYNDETQVIDTLAALKADLLISACYGQKIPWEYIQTIQHGGLNVHPSVLPRWRGADPVPWAILTGDHQTGVTLVTLSKEFDQGAIIAQKKVPITDNDTSDDLRTKLFSLGAKLLIENLSEYLKNPQRYVSSPSQQHDRGQASIVASYPYARRLSREDGFLPWELIKASMENLPSSTIKQFNNITIVKDYMKYQKKWNQEKSMGIIIERFHRALSPWPGLWTTVQLKSQNSKFKTEKKRLKILSCHLTLDALRLVLDSVQLEGKTPVPFSQFSSAYHLSDW